MGCSRSLLARTPGPVQPQESCLLWSGSILPGTHHSGFSGIRPCRPRNPKAAGSRPSQTSGMCAGGTDKSAFRPGLTAHRIPVPGFGVWGRSSLQKRILMCLAWGLGKDDPQVHFNNLAEIIHPFGVCESVVFHTFRAVQPLHHPVPEHSYHL